MADNGSFVRGAALLAGASLASRLIGGLARIPLTRLLGGEGMGLFQMANVVYTLAITFAVSGLTVAMSRMVAERLAGDRGRENGRLLILALAIALVTGLGFWQLLEASAGMVAADVLGDPRAASVIRAIAPSVIPVYLIAALKGYFQGHQRMEPSSGAQVVEQTVRVAVMLWLVITLREQGLERAVGGAAWANLVGATVALIVLIYILARPPFSAGSPARPARPAPPDRPDRSARRRPARLSRSPGLLGPLLGLATAVTLGAAMLPLMDAVQTFLVPGRLQAAGIDPGQVTYLYGQLHGMAYPLAGLPAILASAVGAALVPSIAEALARGSHLQVAARTETALRLTVLFSLPAMVGLIILAEPINQMLFGIPEAGVPLVYVSGACVLLALQQTSSGVLQGLGRPAVPLWGLVGGLFANAATTYYLAALPALGINGAALGIVAGFLVASTVNLAVVVRTTRARWDWAGLVLKPALATAVMAVLASAAYSWVHAPGGLALGNTAGVLAGVTAGVIGYAVSLLVSGGVGERELVHIPILGRLIASRRGGR